MASSQGSASGTLVQKIVVDLENEMVQHRQQIRVLRNCHTIFRFPSILSGVEEGIQKPMLVSFGPFHKDGEFRFQNNKTDFLYRFLERIERSSRSNLVQQLCLLEESIRDCYYGKTNSISGEDFIRMMLADGSFIVELFLQKAEDLDSTWPWFNVLNTLMADLLKLENQLPFFVLENLFLWSCKTSDQVASSQALRTMALRFFSQALGRPLDMVYQKGRRPKHLLDLIHSSLLPSTPSRNNLKAFRESIQCAEMLCNAGITLRRKKANSLLEIDFRKVQIPPFALKIPPLAIDELTSTILVNCVALEQCSHSTSKHFTAYIRFMNCLLRQPEDAQLLREANIITHIQRDNEYVISLLDSVRKKVYFNDRDNYLCKQYKEINSHYDSLVAYLWGKIACYNSSQLVVSILAVIIALGSWLFTWLLPKKRPPF